MKLLKDKPHDNQILLLEVGKMKEWTLPMCTVDSIFLKELIDADSPLFKEFEDYASRVRAFVELTRFQAGRLIESSCVHRRG